MYDEYVKYMNADPVFKLVESVLLGRLQGHLSTPANQFGFKQHYGTDMYRSKSISLNRLDYCTSTDIGVLQGNMTWCFHKYGSQCHWIRKVYDAMDLPVPEIESVTSSEGISPSDSCTGTMSQDEGYESSSSSDSLGSPQGLTPQPLTPAFCPYLNPGRQQSVEGFEATELGQRRVVAPGPGETGDVATQSPTGNQSGVYRHALDTGLSG
ncbi:hypothetical protein Bbelb_381570 [Branchiostoma belcheri]|nr:hypothetical protein Bbelb_381570 [Branchiostoma belcheri]